MDGVISAGGVSDAAGADAACGDGDTSCGYIWAWLAPQAPRMLHPPWVPWMQGNPWGTGKTGAVGTAGPEGATRTAGTKAGSRGLRGCGCIS